MPVAEEPANIPETTTVQEPNAPVLPDEQLLRVKEGVDGVAASEPAAPALALVPPEEGEGAGSVINDGDELSHAPVCEGEGVVNDGAASPAIEEAPDIEAEIQGWVDCLKVAVSPDCVEALAATYKDVFGPDYERCKTEVWRRLSPEFRTQIRSLMASRSPAPTPACEDKLHAEYKARLTEESQLASPTPEPEEASQAPKPEVIPKAAFPAPAPTEPESASPVNPAPFPQPGDIVWAKAIPARCVGYGRNWKLLPGYPARVLKVVRLNQNCEAVAIDGRGLQWNISQVAWANGDCVPYEREVPPTTLSEVSMATSSFETEADCQQRVALASGGDCVQNHSEQQSRQPNWLSREELRQAEALQPLGFTYIGRVEEFSCWSEELGACGLWKFRVTEGEIYLDAICRGAIYSKCVESEPGFGSEGFCSASWMPLSEPLVVPMSVIRCQCL